MARRVSLILSAIGGLLVIFFGQVATAARSFFVTPIVAKYDDDAAVAALFYPLNETSYLGLKYGGLLLTAPDGLGLLQTASPPNCVSGGSRYRVPDNLRWAPNVTTCFAETRSLALRPKAVALACQDYVPRQRPVMAPCAVRISGGGCGGGGSDGAAGNTTASTTSRGSGATYGPHELRYEPGVDLNAFPPLSAGMMRFALPPGQVTELKFELVGVPDTVRMFIDDFAYDLVSKN